MAKTMSRNRKIAIVGLLLCIGIGVGAVGAQLYLSITMDSMFWSMASSQIEFSSTYSNGGTPKTCVDFDFVGGVISGIDNQTFEATMPWYPDLEVYYKEMVAIHRKGSFSTGEGALDLTWTGTDLADASGMVMLEIWAFRNNMQSTTTTRIGYYNATGSFILDNDFDFIEVGLSGGLSDYIIIGIRAEWSSTPQTFSIAITCIAG